MIITRNGKPVAALVTVNRVTLPKPKNARTGAGLAGLAGGWKGSEDLVKSLVELRRTRPRRSIPLD